MNGGIICVFQTQFPSFIIFQGTNCLIQLFEDKTVTVVDKGFVEVAFDIHFSVPKIYVKSSFGFWACFLCLKMRLHLEC